MEIKFSRLSLPSKGVVVIGVTDDNINSENFTRFIQKSPVDFNAEYGKIVPAAHPEDHNLDLVLLVGLGKSAEITKSRIRKIGGKLAAYLKRIQVEEISLIVAGIENSPRNVASVAIDLVLGLRLRDYRFTKYITDEKRTAKRLKFVDVRLEDSELAEELYQDSSASIENSIFARDLISEPGNILTTDKFAKICEGLSDVGIKVDIFDEKNMTKLGMNSLLAVGQGSEMESKMAVMRWNGDPESDNISVALVGKGVVFDSGGISIKPAKNMDAMKGDMGGAAAVVGAIRSIAQRKVNVNVVAAIGLVENMPSGTAQRPGDVVKAMSGTTIEVLNTDAEGRMVLADVLHYVRSKYEPEVMINLATLTGAVVVSLADVYAGIFSNDDDLASKLIDSGKQTEELLWRFPLAKEYDKMIESDIADIRNIGSGAGAGSITAAQFLQRFVGDTKWAHLDIAGVSMYGSDKDLCPKGASGFGVRLLEDFIIKNYGKSAV
jgi:leucyl aminopeptidase